MSIPGLGQFTAAAVPTASTASASSLTTATISLQPFWEYRFEVPFSSSLNIRLTSGLAEKDGTELAPGVTYTFKGTKSKINTWQGCELDVSSENAGPYDAYISQLTADETPLVSYLNLHMKLEGLRATAAANKSSDAMGPRVLVVGPSNSGKTSLARMLTGWASRMGRQPVVVNTDPTQGMLSLPGTLSAAVFATLMDITTEWGGTPSSGPAGIPVKLPLAYYYGLEQPEGNMKLFKSLLSRLAAASTARLSEDPDVRSSGMVIDSTAVDTSKPNYDILAHIASEFSVNIIISLGSEQVSGELSRYFLGHKTTLGEDIAVIGLDKSGGVVERDSSFMQQVRERVIKEYFFGDARRNLSPASQNIAFEGVTVWKVTEADTTSDNDNFYDPGATHTSLEKVEPSLMMLNCTVAIMYAGPRDSPEAIRDANIMGFLYVTDVDEKKRRLKVLSPVNARLGDRPLIWGNWPEPMYQVKHAMSSALNLGADIAWPLYENEPLEGAFEFEHPDGPLDTAVVSKVHRPWLFGFRPTISNGRAVLILGGGGYVQLMVGREGIAVARWLTSLGFQAFVLVHRFPTAQTSPQAPLDDARKALGLMAENADAPNGIGVCGLSSGGHLGAALLAEFPSAWTSSVPAPPKLAFAIIGYGPISTNAAGRTIVPGKPVLEPPEKQALYDAVQPDVQPGAASAPPTFIVYSGSDPVVPVVNAYRLAEGITKAGGAVELHVFADAPHGFGLDTVGLPVSKWPDLCKAWLEQNDLLRV
ncbi:putative Polynucleotide 5'-hydroxyl-kinase GRC3 [Seiridium unicorne]|uniref:Polynucleotide 5'-hydroxyl-kinase GRC3 n=1 Tax=Seiridium unicorne TaxID=138068 RepID=A0ABR2V0H4_9PEZI